MPDPKTEIPVKKPAVAKHKAARIRVPLADIASHIHLPEGVSLAANPAGHVEILVRSDSFADVDKGSEPLLDRSYHSLLSHHHQLRTAGHAVGEAQPDKSWKVTITGGSLSGKEFTGFANAANAKRWCEWHHLSLKNAQGVPL